MMTLLVGRRSEASLLPAATFDLNSATTRFCLRSSSKTIDSWEQLLTSCGDADETKIVTVASNRFSSLELSLLVDLAHDILQDLLNVSDSGAQDCALADAPTSSDVGKREATPDDGTSL